ncbi:recombinase family protein [Amycolatopsis cihanbeyliensis]|uniref:Resolvase-like protein n=1 Tax=Amycolatopsis cihanbeyliensis TaxID=1128664 RepID=A0A542DNN0_AMYCI|nr:recombinase family protein [Amycolatopsis cihanbeyliensis]TQJ04703.1 resolvase-like protein [Amycolatopsis cihanbeyliensis]
MTDFGYTAHGEVKRLRAAGCAQVFAEAPEPPRLRPEFMACLAAMDRGDTLVVPSLVEISRTVRAIMDVVEWLERHDQYLRSLDEEIDTNKSQGRLQLGSMAAMVRAEPEEGRRERDGSE